MTMIVYLTVRLVIPNVSTDYEAQRVIDQIDLTALDNTGPVCRLLETEITASTEAQHDYGLAQVHELAADYADGLIAYHRAIDDPQATVDSVSQSQVRLESARNALHLAAVSHASDN